MFFTLGSSNAAVARRGERMAGLMGASNDHSPSRSPRPQARERFAGLLAGGGETAVNQTSPHPPPRERLSGVFGGGASSGDSGKF